MAQTEVMPQLVDRDTFLALLEQEVARATRYGEELSYISLEIDYFNSLSDIYGRSAANEVLAQVGEAVALACRDSDTAGNVGGGRLGILLPACTRQQSLVAAARVRGSVSEIRTMGLITVSQGLSTYPSHAHTPEGLIKAADEALERSLALGGDRATRSTRGSLYRSNERRKALGKAPVAPLSERRAAAAALVAKKKEAEAPAPLPVKERLNTSLANAARLITAKPAPIVVKETWSTKVEAQLRQIATARFAS
jgi:diguanylate cyclase (GGDEF)-like protein